jgi:hypothetical protein
MNAAQHAVVWDNVADRLKRTAEAAAIDASTSIETMLLALAVFAGTVAAAYKDTAEVAGFEVPATDAQIEAAAEAAYMRSREGTTEWRDVSDKHQDEWRARVRPVVEAALSQSR